MRGTTTPFSGDIHLLHIVLLFMIKKNLIARRAAEIKPVKDVKARSEYMIWFECERTSVFSLGTENFLTLVRIYVKVYEISET